MRIFCLVFIVVVSLHEIAVAQPAPKDSLTFLKQIAVSSADSAAIRKNSIKGAVHGLDPKILSSSGGTIAAGNVKIFPNPSSSETHVVVNSAYAILGVGFYDLMGRQHFPDYSIANNTIDCDVHHLSPGLYLSHITWLGTDAWSSTKYQGTFTVAFIVQH